MTVPPLAACRDQASARPIAALLGVSWWKRKAIAALVGDATPRPRFAETTTRAVALATSAGGGVAVWASREPADLRARAAAAGVPVLTMEDGFIRSVGLGAGLHPPASIVLDGRGIYYDPRRPSDLEHLLETADMPPALLARAAALRERVVDYGISKYGRDPAAPPPPRDPAVRVVLVAGQVEDDRSVLAGGGDVRSNLELLARARALEPAARILFKPHPDVDAGFRVGRTEDAALLAHADEIVRGEAMPSLLARVDAVHVLTSLTGFEALLRGREVIVHGQPFYAGWGLTRDLAGPLPRRTRRLGLDMLVAGALILYPRYLDPVTMRPCTPEALLERFRAMPAVPRRSLVTAARALQGRLARLLGTATD